MSQLEKEGELSFQSNDLQMASPITLSPTVPLTTFWESELERCLQSNCRIDDFLESMMPPIESSNFPDQGNPHYAEDITNSPSSAAEEDVAHINQATDFNPSMQYLPTFYNTNGDPLPTGVNPAYISFQPEPTQPEVIENHDNQKGDSPTCHHEDPSHSNKDDANTSLPVTKACAKRKPGRRTKAEAAVEKLTDKQLKKRCQNKANSANHRNKIKDEIESLEDRRAALLKWLQKAEEMYDNLDGMYKKLLESCV